MVADLHDRSVAGTQERTTGSGLQYVLAQPSGATDDQQVLHVGEQTIVGTRLRPTHLLEQIGFRGYPCGLVVGQACLASPVPVGFDLGGFAESVERAHRCLLEAERELVECGVQMEIGTATVPRVRPYGDGHTPWNARDKAEGQMLSFAFSWLRTQSDAGWVTHYAPKPNSAALSDEVTKVFRLLRLVEHATCPAFEGRPCHWRFTRADPGLAPANVDIVQRQFNAHPDHFERGIAKLTEADQVLFPFGFSLFPRPTPPRQPRVAKKTVRKPRATRQRSR